jgi:dTDP-4-amino-4,6-dideoxygalactose transaminase
MDLAAKYNLLVIEDAAQAIDSFYVGKDGVKKALGSIGHLSAFSFHETKNIMSGEGGMLVINDEKFIERAEIIREKGTNRSSFFRGEVDKYGWVDIGSSFLPSDIIAAFLFAQIENIQDIQSKRKFIWNYYYKNLYQIEKTGLIRLPQIPDFATNNAHMFYIITRNPNDRAKIINALKEKSILSVFHYLSLHKSQYFKDKYIGQELSNSDFYSDNLIRLPLFYELNLEQLNLIINCLKLIGK